jgi:long-chain acyl-CoA synthetase
MRGAKHTEAAAICDKVVFSKVLHLDIHCFFIMYAVPSLLRSYFRNCIYHTQVKEGLGGNVRVILSGAAPLATHVEEYLRVVTCAHVLQGYGTSFLILSSYETIKFYCYDWFKLEDCLIFLLYSDYSVNFIKLIVCIRSTVLSLI